MVKYSVDKIENNIVILENLKNNELKEVNINNFDFEIKENDIIIFDSKYYKDNNLKENRIKYLKEKYEKLKKRS